MEKQFARCGFLNAPLGEQDESVFLVNVFGPTHSLARVPRENPVLHLVPVADVSIAADNHF